MVRHLKSPSHSWRTFLKNNAKGIVTAPGYLLRVGSIRQGFYDGFPVPLSKADHKFYNRFFIEEGTETKTFIIRKDYSNCYGAIYHMNEAIEKIKQCI